MPRVSVVVPAYNVERYVAACLASVQAQTLADWECIVVDDGSSDASCERVRQHRDARVRLIEQPNQGVSSARNAGLASARSPYVLFLDGDDMLHPDALRRLASALDEHRQAVAAYGTLWQLFEDGRAYPQKALHRRSRNFASGHLLERMLCGDNLLQTGTILVRTPTASALGGFRTHLRLGEDWEFLCRLAAQGEFRFIGTAPEVLRHRMRTASASRVLSPDWHNHLPTIEAITSNPELARHFDRKRWRRLTRQILAYHLWEAGRMNFISRRFGEARRLMIRSFGHAVTAKRLALFIIAQASQLFGVSLVSRLRFRQEDGPR